MATCKRNPGKRSQRVDGLLLYTRFTYCIDGLSEGLSDDQIIAIGQDAGNAYNGLARNKLPDNDGTYDGLTSPKFDVFVSNRIRGRATVTATWGRRFYNVGPLTDVEGVSGGSTTVDITIPYTATSIQQLDGVSAEIAEVRDFPFVRGASIRRMRRILPSSVTPAQVDEAFLSNFRKLYPDRGILHDYSIQEINQSQSYITTDFINYSAVRSFDVDKIEAGSIAVNELPVNGEYKRPDPNGTPGPTQVLLPGDIYETGGQLPWLP